MMAKLATFRNVVSHGETDYTTDSFFWHEQKEKQRTDLFTTFAAVVWSWRKENQLRGYNLGCRRWKQEPENPGCSQDQSESGRSLWRRSTYPGGTGRRTVSQEESWDRSGQTARGRLFGGSREGRLYSVRGGLALWTGLALFNQNVFFFSFKLPPCFSPVSIASDVFCCFRILARLLSGYCVKFKGWERDEIIVMCSTV